MNEAEDPIIQGLYSPSQRAVGCVILQTMFGGDRRVCTAVTDWEVNVQDDFIMVTAPLSQWVQIGRVPRDQRPGPEAFAPREGTTKQKS